MTQDLTQTSKYFPAKILNFLYKFVIFRSFCQGWFEQGKIFQKIQKCLQQKEFTQYSTTVKKFEIGNYELKNFFNTTQNIQFGFSSASNTKNIYEEVLLFDDIGLVGSLGGSLGLFVGFSFFGYVTPILEFLIDKADKLLPAGIPRHWISYGHDQKSKIL